MAMQSMIGYACIYALYLVFMTMIHLEGLVTHNESSILKLHSLSTKQQKADNSVQSAEASLPH